MTYIMSDLHGRYELYRRMLEQIAFSDDDVLYVLGDVCDRGEGSAALLGDMSMRPNVIPIMGNHDLLAAKMLRKLCVPITGGNYDSHLTAQDLSLLYDWQSDGGDATLKAFRALDPEERELLIEYLEEFSPYEQIECEGERYLLVHGGIAYEKRGLPIGSQSVYEMLITRPDYARRYYSNTTLITGHTPTVNIDPAYAGRIYRSDGHIAVDCGAGHGMALGCLRLEDGAEFYVEP